MNLLLQRVLPKASVIIDYEVQTLFTDIGERTMLVSAERLSHPDTGQRFVLLTIIDATERRAHEREREVLLGETQPGCLGSFGSLRNPVADKGSGSFAAVAPPDRVALNVR